MVVGTPQPKDQKQAVLVYKDAEDEDEEDMNDEEDEEIKEIDITKRGNKR